MLTQIKIADKYTSGCVGERVAIPHRTQALAQLRFASVKGAIRHCPSFHPDAHKRTGRARGFPPSQLTRLGEPDGGSAIALLHITL